MLYERQEREGRDAERGRCLALPLVGANAISASHLLLLQRLSGMLLIPQESLLTTLIGHSISKAKHGEPAPDLPPQDLWKEREKDARVFFVSSRCCEAKEVNANGMEDLLGAGTNYMQGGLPFPLRRTSRRAR
ncbi:hypothetical protein cyc_01148 [Cyclospora cayetanensis]|uniref:Uncharacterized protein n=1 Tax=Cyclospora cayetanensis TaxID=88456 RepID=A0A1D3D9Z6_9EIME|nr:hypothetical protein cyc_01148 [Cyclospora cayetanensis]